MDDFDRLVPPEGKIHPLVMQKFDEAEAAREARAQEMRDRYREEYAALAGLSETERQAKAREIGRREGRERAEAAAGYALALRAVVRWAEREGMA